MHPADLPLREASASGVLGRRRLLALGVGALAVASVPLVASRRARVVRRRIPAMGTIAEIVVVTADEPSAQAAIDAAFGELRRIEATMTAYSDASEVGRANVGAGRDAVGVSAETAFVVAEALRWSEATGGAFDPCLGAAARAWDVLHRAEPPEPAMFRHLAARSLWRAVDVGTFRGAPALRFTDPDVRLDLGAIAKGYAVDRAAMQLRSRGFHDALVNVGGDLVALGRSASGEPWRVGIQAPDDPDTLVGAVDAEDTAIATSGDYVRAFTWRGRRYHHLLDPRTAEPRLTAQRSLTVQGGTCMEADAAATAVYGATRETADRVLAARGASLRVVHSA